MPEKQAIRRRMHSGRVDSSKNCADSSFERDMSHRAGLRYWPARHLVASAPWLAKSAARATFLASKLRGERCAPLWRKSLAMRGAARAKMRRLGLDVWFLPRT